MRRRKHSIGKSILMGLAFVAVFALVIAVVMLLWNAIVPSVIGWTAITYWQAAGILILARILFGKIGRPGGHGRFCGRRHHHQWDDDIHEKMKNMSREERKEYIRSRMREHRNGPFCEKEKNDDNGSDIR